MYCLDNIFRLSQRPKRRLCLLPQRYIMALLLFFGVLTNFTIRISFKLALNQLVVPANVSRFTNKNDICYYNETQKQSSPVNTSTKNLYDWSAASQTSIAKAFFYGYFFGHFPGGYFSDKYGGKIVLSCCTFVTIILTVFTPVMLTGSSHDYNILTGLQGLTGFSIGMLFPSVHSILAHWTPARDRGKLSSIVFCATQFAVVFRDAVSVSFIVYTDTWSSLLYLQSSLAAIWLVVWLVFGQATYRNSPLATEKEYAYLQEELETLLVDKVTKIPWIEMLFSIRLWALIIAQFGHTWMWHVMIKDLPKYMMSVLKFDLKQSYYIAAVPYLTMGVLTLSTGFLVDFLINKRVVEITTNRKSFTTFGAVGPAIFVVAAAYAACARKTAVFLFTVGMGMMSFYYSGTRINTLDLAPNYSGIIMGIVNGIGALPGIILPEIRKYWTLEDSYMDWIPVFWLHLAILFATCFFFAVFGSGRVQPWNDYEEEEIEAADSNASPFVSQIPVVEPPVPQ
ncbi:sialin-like isoform X2 [Zophobas morio]|uniref:sialin-like isoform X2 n=1 Tax=Zophobas morio TaxID=2755281 RepID=UPI0030836DBD